jgi:hypothetical protein
MPRPKRPGWSKITITVSEEVAQAIRINAAERNTMMGTFVDELVRSHWAVSKPPSRELPQSTELQVRFPPETLSDTAPERPISKAFSECQGEPESIADFLYREALVANTADVFSPLPSLKVFRGQTGDGIAYSAFEAFITSAIELTPIYGCTEWDEETRSQLNSMLLALECLYQRFDEEVPYKPRVIWGNAAASAFGSILEELILDGGGADDEVAKSVSRVTQMVKNLLQSFPTAFLEAGGGWSSAEWTLHLRSQDSEPEVEEDEF